MTGLLNPIRPNASRRHVRWRGLAGSAAALALAESLQADSRLFVVVTPGVRELERLRAGIRFFGGLTDRADERLLTLPDWEILPYDLFSPHPDIISERLHTLYRLPDLKRGCLLVSAGTLQQRLPPAAYVRGRAFDLAVGQHLEVEAFRRRLADAGYASVGQVNAPGEFAVRGSLLDVFPMGVDAPLRIDLFGEEIEAIRRFDPETQRSSASIEHLRLLPARELPLDPEAIKGFRRRYRTRFEGDPMQSPVYRTVSEGAAPPGVEFYLPLFYDATASLFDYLPRDTVIVHEGGTGAALEQLWSDIAGRYEDRRHDIERPILSPAELFLEPAELAAAAARLTTIAIDPPAAASPAPRPRGLAASGPAPGPVAAETAAAPTAVAAVAAVAGTPAHAAEETVEFPTAAPPELRIDAHAERALAPLSAFLADFRGRVLIAADSPGRREVLAAMLAEQGLPVSPVADWAAFAGGSPALALTVAPDIDGLRLDSPRVAVLSETQLFGARARQERRRRPASDPAAILRDLTDLNPGAPVVHEEYGVGRYVGLTHMEVAGAPGEFLVLEYQGGDRIYVPVQALRLVSRYTGAAPEHAPLHRLGTDQWARARRRAAEQVRDTAAELLDLYARRKAQQAAPLTLRDADYQAFAAAFPFEETPDQAEAIRRVIADLGTTTPMDRIVCGDVGFGKTEVAMRAAFAAVQAGRQVAVLVPTTLLAQQHTANFRDRFADWPVRIESLSRFRTGRESEAVLAGIESGAVDIVIATHRLLHAPVRFRNLGLIIVDEEHRFGVRDKERLKALRAEVHVLTLTATPIPRTLNMALGGLRDLSLITTAPAARTAIKTFVAEWHAPTIREACLRELRRGGQIYFVHNEVRDIEKTAAMLRALVPEAQLRVGHGQMRERELEQLMVEFYHRRFNLLVCTTIIESGIDVPTANTIMIDRADRFGLAQLHQLRGRVGRSHHRAYAYLITPPRRELTPDAVKRLAAIESLEDLGAGFVLSTHDLEIRGAGELLGESQSGELSEVGLAMYLDMLEEAVRALKAGREPALERPLAAATEVELHQSAFLPADYVADVHVRLVLYKRIAAADAGGLEDLTAELVDRFGPLPQSAQNLLQAARLTQRARALGIRRLDIGAQAGYVLFDEHNSIDPGVIIRLIQRQPKELRLEGSLKLRVTPPKAGARAEYAAALLARLSGQGG
ncbi:MAG TPA: transcription-repair coupling factor [Steroidobacteraceae bacterium]|nr:transcription-repair coupling factor [Steroidobacteraceae bacterium]